MLRLLLLLLTLIPVHARELVIIDTDSGVFGDDGAALVMLARSPKQIGIAGVTIVPGNVWARQGAEYTINLMHLLHQTSAVYTGTWSPILNSTAMAKEFQRRWGPVEYMGAFAMDPREIRMAPGARALGQKAASQSAVQFMIEQVEKHPRQVTLLGLGPLTNIALMLTLRPDLAAKVKQIVLMGGNIKVPGNASKAAEFNFWFDPEAARIVLRSAVPKKVMFALDVCNKAPVKKPQFDQIVTVKTPITALFAEDYGKRYPGFYAHPDATVYMWDSLAAGWLLDPEYAKNIKDTYLDVQTTFGAFYGATVPLDRRLAPDATPVAVVGDVDAKRAWALFRALMVR